MSVKQSSTGTREEHRLSRNVREGTIGAGAQFDPEQGRTKESPIAAVGNQASVNRDSSQSPQSYSLIRFASEPASESPFNGVHLAAAESARANGQNNGESQSGPLPTTETNDGTSVVFAASEKTYVE
ncbi:hypothetical protein EKO04_001958 [Ascochyta lentis]|uniref:Uncharacterized protein n=1 Tax=Ascochyta lentis TaxID=205686 RepID=A0A8H7MHE9_9PLEO|nr:hypothetical protein EKO04_001958 [Ascochyta lentis]